MIFGDFAKWNLLFFAVLFGIPSKFGNFCGLCLWFSETVFAVLTKSGKRSQLCKSLCLTGV